MMITMSMIKNKYVNYTSKEQDCQDCRSANGVPTIRQVRGKQLSPVDGHILSHKSLEPLIGRLWILRQLL